MSKSLVDNDSLKYQKQLEEFMQQINPKPTLEIIEKLKQQYLERRGESSENLGDTAKKPE